MKLQQLRERRKKARGDNDYTPHKWRYVTTEDLITATKSLIPKLPNDITGIAGVPRSGMPPASCLATWLNLPLFEATESGLRQLGNGCRASRLVASTNKTLILDDTLYSGRSLERVRSQDKSLLYAVVFVRPNKTHLVDFYGEVLPSPHLLEWNLYNSGILAGNTANPAINGGWALDFDGVLCYDCPHDGQDTPETDEAYRQWILNAKPKWLPRLVPIPLVITARLERYRRETLDWCSRWGIKINRLVMHPATSFKDRNENYDIAAWKASILKNTTQSGYVDSHTDQAERINLHWGRPTISLQNGKVYQ